MDISNLAKEAILKNMTPEQQQAVLDSVMASVQESKKARSQKVAENVDLVLQALKKIEAQMLDRVGSAASKVEEVAASVKDGKDGRDGKDGKDGKPGIQGPKGADGRDGRDGKDGKDGRDGVDGISVTNAFLDFDNSLVIELSDGRQINVGGVLSTETSDKVRVVANGGGTSQTVLDALAALQAEIDAIVQIPSQTGNSGKFLTTNGSTLSWANVAGGLNYQGTWNASTNTPTLASSTGTNGYYYVVSVAGSTNLDGITDWKAGDWLVFNGSTWQKIDQSWAQTGANSDITSMSGLTGPISSPTYVQFGNGSSTTLAAGRMWYDETTGSMNVGMGNGNITQQIGEELFIYGKASSAITEGQLIVKTGAVGASGVITFAPAPTGLTDNDGIIGVATENIALNGFGRITTFGVVHGINTTGSSVGETWADGDVLYYNPSYVGGLTKVKPSAPYAKFQVGVVTHAGSGSSGSIQVDLLPGSTLGGTDSNVQTNGLTNGNILTYNGTGSYWKNTALTAGTGISVSAASDGALTVTNSAPDQTVSITAGTGITKSGTYPNFTITNSAPDQTVSITGAGTTSVTGTYPNFTVTSNDQYTGTVTSVTAGTGLSGGIITSSGTIALANTAVSAGSYTNASITVDAQGRLTAASSGTAPVTSVSGTAGRITSSGGTTPTIDLATTAVTAGSYTAANITVDAYGRITSAASGSSGMVYPGAGIAVSTGSAWTTSKTAPSGAIVGDTDTQTLTNKTIQGGAITRGTTVASTSGTAIDFTSIPSWVKRITVMFNGVSLSSNSPYGIVQIGAGSVTSSGYINTLTTLVSASSVSTASFTTGFAFINFGNAADTVNGMLVLASLGSNVWVASGTMTNSNSLRGVFTAGNITLGGTLDRVRITTTDGTTTFDAGSINILYEG